MSRLALGMGLGVFINSCVHCDVGARWCYYCFCSWVVRGVGGWVGSICGEVEIVLVVCL